MSDENKLRILLADDHKMVRAGMKQLLLSCDRISCEIEEAESGKDAVRKG